VNLIDLFLGNEQIGGCGYVEWLDPLLSKFHSDLFSDLRDAVWKLQAEAEENGMPCTSEEMSRKYDLCAALQDQLGKDAEISAIRGRCERKEMMMMYRMCCLGSLSLSQV
jgi:hypothetical protein